VIIKIFDTETGLYIPKNKAKKLINDSITTGFFFTTDCEDLSTKNYTNKHSPKYIVQVKE